MIFQNINGLQYHLHVSILSFISKKRLSSSNIMIKKHTKAEETWAMLTSGAAPASPEDRRIRGME